ERPGDATLLGCSEAELAAVEWLKGRLVKPRRIAELTCEWLGGELRKQEEGPPKWEGGAHHADDKILLLNRAARLLGIHAWIGVDGKFWWRLPAAEAKEAA